MYQCLCVSIESVFLSNPDRVGLLRWLKCDIRTEYVVLVM